MKRFIAFFTLVAIVFSTASCKRMPDDDGDVAMPAGSQQESAENLNQDEGEQLPPSTEAIQTEDEQPEEEKPQDVTQKQLPPHLPADVLIYGDHERVIDPNDPNAQRLIKIYGNGTVICDHNDTYGIITDTVTLKDYGDPPAYEPPNYPGWDRDAIERTEDLMNLKNDIVIRAIPTGRTLQRANHFLANPESIGFSDVWSYVEFEIIESYYGIKRPGEYVWIGDSFGLALQNNELKLNESNYSCGAVYDGIEYVIHASTYDGKEHYSFDKLSPLRLDVEHIPYSDDHPGAEYCIYKKYIVDKDYAFDRDREIMRFHIYNFNQYWNETYAQHQGNPDKTYEHPDFAPTEWQLALIDEQEKYYAD